MALFAVFLSNHSLCDAGFCVLFKGAGWVESQTKFPDRHTDQAEKEHYPGRNEPCICGSGKKFKHCCLRKVGTRRSRILRFGAYAFGLAILVMLIAGLILPH